MVLAQFDCKWPRQEDTVLWALVHVIVLSSTKVVVDEKQSVPEASPKHKLCLDLNEPEPQKFHLYVLLCIRAVGLLLYQEITGVVETAWMIY